MKTERQSIKSQASQINQASNRLVLINFIFAMGFLVFFLTYLPATLYGNNGPIASISEKQFDFGQVADGSEVVHDFLIKNPGTEMLTISDVKTG